MNDKKMYDAMTQIDESLTERAIAGINERMTITESKKPQKTKGFALRKALPAALLIVLTAAAVTAAVMLAKPAKPQAGTEPALRVGFGFENEKTVSGARIAVTADKTRINVGEALRLSVYSVCGSKDEKAPSSATARVLLSYSRIDPDNMVETVKVIDDPTAAGYTWNGSLGQMKKDEIVIPAAAFTKAEEPTLIRGLKKTDGVIVLALEVNKKYSDGSESTDKDGAAIYYRIEDNEVLLKPSDETLELARTAVEKCEQAVIFVMGTSSDLTHTLYDEYEKTASWVAPELMTLETKSDASIALIKLYEDVLKEFRTCDLDGWYDFQIKTAKFLEEHAPYPVAQIQYSEENRRIQYLFGTRRVIEALLALDRYYDQLGEEDVSRMLNDFSEFAEIDSASQIIFFDDASNETLFEQFREWRFGTAVIDWH